MYTDTLFAGLSGRFREGAAADSPPKDVPLLVALHGGSYNSSYFDLPGYSLLERASRAGVPVLAPDRPGYGASATPPPSDQTIQGQARILARSLEDAWARYGKSTRGVVLIGHSIGGAIATAIAGEKLAFPLLGLAVSGVGLHNPPHFKVAWSSLPDQEKVVLPVEIKDQVMFGPPGSFDSSMPAASHITHAPAPRVEILDIVTAWGRDVLDIAARVPVPVHYRQAEGDRLWIVDAGEIKAFAAAFHRAPRVDAAMITGTGHCMDFHRAGAALHHQQIGFALQCACESDQAK